MANTTITNTKLVLSLKDDAGTYSYSKIKNDASDEAVYELGNGLNSLQAYEFEKMYRVIESEISE